MLKVQNFKPLSSLKNWRRIVRVEREVVGAHLQFVLRDPSRQVSLPNFHHFQLLDHRPTNLSSDEYALADLKTALASGGFFTCAGLIAINRDQDIHYLAHVHDQLDPKQIDHSLNKIGLSDSEILMVLNRNSWNTAKKIYSVLLNRKVAEKARIFVGKFPIFAVISAGGQVCCLAV